MTAAQISAGDAIMPKLEKMWAWYLAGGVISVLFGFVVISQPVVSLVALAVLASIFFIAVGAFQLVGSASMAGHRWLYLAMGVLWIGLFCLLAFFQ